MPKKDDKCLKQSIVETALKLAEVQAWDNITLADIAAEADITLAELFDIVEDKTDILVLFGRMIDRRTLEGVGEADPSVSPRDALFDILMERYEVLNDYRVALKSVLKSFKFDPKQALISAPHLCRSMTWMLEAAGVETSGMRGAVKVAGLTGVYLKTLKVWCDDESVDLGKTMAALDKDLSRAEQLANSFGF